jgi:stearoyl-CoA desaturase (delta-9 desaturase)
MIGLGEPLSYAMTHIVHHRHSDTELDPHGPVRGKHSWLIWFQKTVDPKETPVFSKHIAILNKKYGWLHRFYIPFVLVNAGILWLIDYRLFLFVWLIPASLACWGIGWAVWRQHWHFEPNNSPIHRWDYLYEGLHLNHHLYPAAPDTAINPKEIDWTYQTSKLFNPKYNWQGQPNRDWLSD